MFNNKGNFFNYDKDFDVLRAFSVILVILFHLNEKIFFFGFVGVDIFFFISGYVITQSLFNYYNKYETKDFILSFFFRRIKRIFPALLLVLIFSLFIYLMIIPYGDHQLMWTVKSFIFSIFGISNLYFYKNIESFNYFNFEQSTPFLHTWSLGVEEQFYIIFPFILIFFLRLNINYIYLKYFLLGLLIVSLFYFLNNNYSLGHFYLLTSRAWEILLGAIFFLFRHRVQLNIKISKVFINILIFVFLIITIFILIYGKPIDYRHYILTTLTIIILFMNFKDKNSKIFLEEKFIYVGKLSYSLYLWHFPILFFSNYYLIGFLKYIFVIIFTFVFSHFSYYRFELPIRKMTLKISYVRGLFSSVIIILLIFLTAHFIDKIKIRNLVHQNIVNINKIFKDLNLTQNTVEHRVANKWILNNDICHSQIENFGSNYLNCISHMNNKKLFFISGDSFGEHFVNVLTSNKSSTFKNIYLSKVKNKSFLKEEKLDINTINDFKKISKDFEDSYFILSISYHIDTEISQLVKFFKYLPDTNIIIIRPHHRPNKFIKQCIEYNSNFKIISSYINSKVCEYDYDYDINRIIEINKKLSLLDMEFKNIKFFDFNKVLCNSLKCNLYDKNNDIIYFTDNTHLTKEAADLISLDFEKWFINEF